MPDPFSKTEILTFLKSYPVMSIATINNEKPLSSVVLYYVDENFDFYFITRESSFKAKALKKDNRISFSVWNPYEMMVQADGLVEVLNHNTEKIMDKIVESIKQVGTFWPPIFYFSGDEYVIFKIKPTWLRALDIKGNQIASEQPNFTEIGFQTI